MLDFLLDYIWPTLTDNTEIILNYRKEVGND